MRSSSTARKGKRGGKAKSQGREALRTTLYFLRDTLQLASVDDDVGSGRL